MKFGSCPVADATHCYLGHSVKTSNGRFKKGHLLSAEDVAALQGAGIETVTIAKLDEEDVHEQEAAFQLASSVSGKHIRVEPPFTGRSNLFAERSGIFIADKAKVDALNHLHASMTLATLSNYTAVPEGKMLATAKIIPFAAPRTDLEKAKELGDMVRVAPFVKTRVGLVATMLPSLKASTMDKTRRILDERLAFAGATVAAEERVAHDDEAIAEGLSRLPDVDLVIVFGASANVDDEDVVPSGIRLAGGELIHFGMPVDPGNLLVLSRLNETPVIGAPGCARSPAENGFDWVLYRLLADVEVTADDIRGMGVGGLLMEITSRPQPRENTGKGERVAAIILAAGRSTRMGGPNKLLAEVEGKALVRHVAEAACASKADEVIVVTGHMADEVQAALAGLDVRFVHNPDYAQGLSTSLNRGLSDLSDEVGAALIALGDMPFVTTGHMDALISMYDSDENAAAVVSTANGKRGNPVLWGRRFFDELKQVRGDTGGRHIIGQNEAVIAEVELGDAVAHDLDTPEALAKAGGKIV